MLGLEGEEIHQSNLGWSPVYVHDTLGVMSIGFMLPNPDDAVIWRGPRKNGLIKQFLKDVHWGSLDFLIVDAPPGTSDEHISVVQFLKPCNEAHGNLSGAVIVTTPQQVAIIDVRKEISFCRKTGVDILGVVENMSRLCMPLERLCIRDMSGNDVTAKVVEAGRHAVYSTGATQENGLPDGSHGGGLDGLTVYSDVFYASGGGADALGRDMNVDVLGKIPLDGCLSRAGEEGKSIFEEEGDDTSNGDIGNSRVLPGTHVVKKALNGIIEKILEKTSKKKV